MLEVRFARRHVAALQDRRLYRSNRSTDFKRFIPLISAGLGAVIGVVAFYFVPGVIETQNILVAITIGAASGLSATGTNQAVKQLVKGADTNETR